MIANANAVDRVRIRRIPNPIEILARERIIAIGDKYINCGRVVLSAHEAGVNSDYMSA